MSLNRRTPRRPGDLVSVPVAAGVVIPDGALVVARAGYAAPGELAEGLAYLGRAEQRMDNSEGAAGGQKILVRRTGMFRWDNAPGTDAVTQADVGKTAYIFDGRTVTRTAAGASPAGIILDVDEDGVWLDGSASPSAQAAAGGAGLTLLHSPLVSPAVERMAPVVGQIRGSIVLDISDISAFTAISDGTLTIGGTTIIGIDLSAATTINEVVNAITAAVQLALPTYTVSLDYINPNFYGRILRSDGDVPTVGGTLEPLFGFDPPAARTDHAEASPNIVLPAGSWSHLQFRFLGQSYRNQYWYCQSDFWSVEALSLSQYLAYNNSGGWNTSSFSDPAGGPLTVAVLQAYNLTYISIQYDPASREISWTEERTLPSANSWAPSIDTLTVLGS